MIADKRTLYHSFPPKTSKSGYVGPTPGPNSYRGFWTYTGSKLTIFIRIRNKGPPNFIRTKNLLSGAFRGPSLYIYESIYEVSPISHEDLLRAKKFNCSLQFKFVKKKKFFFSFFLSFFRVTLSLESGP